MYNMMPWVMRRVPGPHRRIFTGWKEVISFINIRIQEHMKDNDPSSPRDFIDCFLNEIEKVTMIMTTIIGDVVVKKKFKLIAIRSEYSNAPYSIFPQ